MCVCLIHFPHSKSSIVLSKNILKEKYEDRKRAYKVCAFLHLESKAHKETLIQSLCKVVQSFNYLVKV